MFSCQSVFPIKDPADEKTCIDKCVQGIRTEVSRPAIGTELNSSPVQCKPPS